MDYGRGLALRRGLSTPSSAPGDQDCSSSSVFVLSSLLSYNSAMAPFVPTGKAASPAAWPLLRAATRRICGGHRKPLFSAKHSHHWNCQHHPARRQRAGAPELRYGLHSDRRYHQCEPSAPSTCWVGDKFSLEEPGLLIIPEPSCSLHEFPEHL